MSAQPDKIALFDLDGTLANYSGAMAKALDSLRAPVGPVVDIETEWAQSKELPDYIEARMDVIKGSPGFWSKLAVLDDGMALLHNARRIGFKIHILTKGPRRTFSAWGEKLQWCHEHLEEPFDVTVTMRKGLVYGTVLVDDYPPYCKQWLKWRPRGWVIMPTRPYNMDAFKDHPQVFHFNVSHAGQMAAATERLQEAFDRG